MTAQTMPAQPAEDTALRPLPWRRMAGVIWRQHRFVLVTVAALLEGKVDVGEGPTVAIFSGGNVEWPGLRELLGD